jgi:hypothetical protein
MKWSTDEISYIMSFVAKLFLVFLIIIFTGSVLAPLFGGRFILSGILVNGGWIGFALCVLFEARRIKEKQVDDPRVIFANAYEFLFWIFWWLISFSFPYNVIGGTLGGGLFLFLKLSWYKRLKREIARR